MSKPGEIIQVMREDYEEILEAYRLLRNKFLIAVPGMNLDAEKLKYEHWKMDLHLNSIITFDRKAQAPEAEKVEGPQVDDKVYVPPCEACGNVNRHNPSCPIMRERRIHNGA